MLVTLKPSPWEGFTAAVFGERSMAAWQRPDHRPAKHRHPMAKLEINHQFKDGGILTEIRDDYIRIEKSTVDIDADGANGQHGKPPAYAPESFGETLDILRDAGRPGKWWALATDSSGQPIVQGKSDPCPGAYISETSLHLPKPDGSEFDPTDPMCYVDAATVPFLVICPELVRSVKPVVMGCRAVLTNTAKSIKIEAVVADGGNSNEMGEISLAAAQQLQIPGNARGVDTSEPLLTMEIYPGVAAVVDGVTYPLQPS